MARKHRLLPGLFKESEGGAAVEFAIVLNILLLILVGIIDFGHAFFLRQVVTNASREGARAGVVYPHPLAGIQTAVTTGVKSHLPSNMVNDPNLKIQVTPGTGATADPLTVTVTYTKTWWILNYFLPAMGDTVDVQAQTVMRYE